MTKSNSLINYPQFYLAGFTASGNKTDRLWVIDQKERKCWQSKPKSVALQRDFYRIEVPHNTSVEVEQDDIEKALADLEGRVAEVVKNITVQKRLPEGDDFDLLLEFFAFLAVRTPAFRSTYTEPIEQVAKKMLRMMVATPDHWSATIERVQRQGTDLPGVHTIFLQILSLMYYTHNCLWDLPGLLCV